MGLDISLVKDYHISYDNCKTFEKGKKEVYEAGITHNLWKMAVEAGIYKACWRPEEIDATHAKDIIPLLQAGYDDMKARPDHYKQFNAENGWGLYENFLSWVKNYLNACKKYPETRIEVWR